MKKAIDIKNLHYAHQSHWTFMKKPFLQDLNLSVNRGEAFGFLGHNGAGKTTTIKCIIDLIRPLKGEINILGQNSRTVEARKKIGFLPEAPYFYDHLKISELLSMYAAFKGFGGQAKKNEVKRVLSLVKIDHKRNSKLGRLSKGQIQRVGMAQALLGSPELLILDEPFSGLDPVARKEFSDLLFNLKQTGRTIFISSHILSDIEFLCDRVAIMSVGKLKKVFALSELPNLLPGVYKLKLKNFASVAEQIEKFADDSQIQDKFAYFTFSELDKAEQALSISVASNDVHVEEFRFVHGGLEQIFIDLIKEDIHA